MKKVMFMIVGMLFAVSVNAASLNLINTVGSASIDPASGQWVAASETNFSAPADIFELQVIGGSTGLNFTGDLTPDTITSSFEVFSGNTLLKGLYGNATDSFAFHLFAAAGTYTIKVFSEVTGYHFAIATPIPAALFLFAPALLGFFGLRRKAAVAA